MKRGFQLSSLLFGLALLSALVLMLLSCRWVSFWNVYRFRSGPNQDTIVFMQSVAGYLHAGRYTVDSSVEVPLGLRKDPFHEGYQDFQMSARARQQGFLKAMTFYFERHNQSGFIVVHYAALSFVLGSFFLILNTASRKAGRKKAESSRRG
jgi:hypothetical protein